MNLISESIKTPEKYSVIGQMSGTSLDGMDIGLFRFWEENGRWKFEIGEVETISYPNQWKKDLAHALEKSSNELIRLDRDYGILVGKEISTFCLKHKLTPLLIGCHGHTVWHQPERGFTLQIGHGGAIALHAGILVVNDFRSQDVTLGGQGAPLVPIGDELLFPDLKWCLNIGGIANITDKQSGIAFDICPANLLLNHFALKLALEYDHNGTNARRGKVIPILQTSWLALPYFHTPAPKSLGKEWVEANILSKDFGTYSTEDLLATSVELIAKLVGESLKNLGPQGIVTGGGAHNAYLMERIEFHCGFKIGQTDSRMIDFKEALIFAFMGLLRRLNRVNVLSKYTGSARDHSAGSIWLP
jgi:anhydro-N-acetylmuramic acid kinase